MPAWTEQTIHFIDFEGNRRSGVIEYGVATLRGGQVTGALTRLCCATGRVREDETEVHGLREDDLQGKAPFSAEWELFCTLRAGGPLAAHFAGTENGLLKFSWPYPRLSPDFAHPGRQIADWGPWIDSGSIYAELFPGRAAGKLETLVAQAGLQAELDALAETHCPPERKRYHAALYDALAGALLLCALARHPQFGKRSLLELFAHSTRSGDKRDELQQGTLF